MKIYFFANSIYQLSHALPLYEKLKATFVVHDFKNKYRVKKYLRFKAAHREKNFLNTPDVIVCARKNLKDLPAGILIFFSNSINPQHNYKNLITIFYEHGSSDKKYGDGQSIGAEKIKKYNYIFLWGDKNKQKILDLDIHLPEEKMIPVGGFRFDKYIDKDELRRRQIQQLKIKEPARKCVLYAPTWAFGDGTLKQYAARFAKEITQNYNLIIRPHHHDRNYGKLVYYFSRIRGLKHVYFSQPVDIIKNDILLDFAVSDVLISDLSSVLYEYLITQKPIIIVDNGYENRHNMTEMMNLYNHAEKYAPGMNINSVIENALRQNAAERYSGILRHCFYSINESATDKAVNFINGLISL